jgi:aspartyl-tRNA(Asn)/glutamyl-tRNA(Gln) amidotransferase subunit B
VEIKNLNSVRNVKRAIEYESQRLIDLLEKEQIILQETRSFTADSGTTFSIREKEEAEDYRYFPEPDLTPFHLADDFVDSIRKNIPELQSEKIKRYITEFRLSEYDASVLTEKKDFSEYFENIIEHTPDYKSAANWMLGPVRSWMNENNKTIGDFPLLPVKIAGLVELINSGKMNFSVASTKLFSYMLANLDKEPGEVATEMNLLQESDVEFIQALIEQVISKYPDKVQEYKKGKKGLLALFIGAVIKASKGKADPKLTNELLTEKLRS